MALQKTNWDEYYNKPFAFAHFTRKITCRTLLYFAQKYLINKQPSIIELGGANSCFYNAIKQTLQPKSFTIVDNNEFGLKQFAKNNSLDKHTSLIQADVLNLQIKQNADFVYSIGLIEHFTSEEAQTIIANHSECLKQNGLVVISFPTPTFLYKITRKLSEILRLWIFHDEQPIPMKKAINVFEKHFDILETKILWPIFLTQGFLVGRKKKI
jgi:hypothetical protein